MTVEALFATPEVGIKRDRYDRPLITPIDGGKAVAYTRVSTLAKALSNEYALTKWKQRQVAIGLSLRPALLTSVVAHRDLKDDGDKRTLDEICDQAMNIAGSKDAAALGTATHKLTTYLDRSEDLPTGLDPVVLRDLGAYQSKLETVGIKTLAMERFVVIDALHAAGTFDRLYELADGRVVIGDIKTGKWEARYPHNTCTQLAIYAHGVTYDHVNGRGVDLAAAGVDQNVALMVHLIAGSGECDLYLMPIDDGWRMARVAAGTRAWLSSHPIARYEP